MEVELKFEEIIISTFGNRESFCSEIEHSNLVSYWASFTRSAYKEPTVGKSCM